MDSFLKLYQQHIKMIDNLHMHNAQITKLLVEADQPQAIFIYIYGENTLLLLKKLQTQKANLKRNASAGVDGSEPSQNVFVTPFQQYLNKSTIRQEKITMLILNYLEDEMSRTYTLEKMSFRKLVAGLSHIGKTPSCIILNLKNLLKGVNYVCTTADIGSANNKCYLGVTIHYLDKGLNRKSAVLACKRIKFSHTHKIYNAAYIKIIICHQKKSLELSLIMPLIL